MLAHVRQLRDSPHPKRGVADELALAELTGDLVRALSLERPAPVAVVEGSPTNLKITRPSDLPLAEFLLGAALA